MHVATVFHVNVGSSMKAVVRHLSSGQEFCVVPGTFLHVVFSWGSQFPDDIDASCARRVCRSDGWRSGRVHPRLAATTFHHGRVRSAVCQRCGGRGSLRLYENTYTLACGFGEGLGLGSDVKAAIMRRGLLEIAGFLEEFLPADHPGAMSAQSVFLELCGRAPCCIFGEPQ